MFEEFLKEMERVRKEFDKSFERLLESRPMPEKQLPALRTPVANMAAKGSKVVARLEIPGVEKKDIQLNVTDSYLEVKVEKKAESKVEKKGYYSHETSYKGFYRMMPFPMKVKANEAKADYRNGVLEVIVPKAGAKKALAHKVKVK